MRLAIMQPYSFPYIGYFQLINAVDTFTFLDDVNYINRGWINRNNILINGKSFMFTVPLQNASQNKLITEIEIADNGWKETILKTVEMAYKKAPQYKPVFELVKEVFYLPVKQINELAKQSIKIICAYLEVQTKIIDSSTQYDNKNLRGEARIIDINKKVNSTDYINPIGGSELYNKEKFLEHGINLHFLRTKKITYPQGNNEFVPLLSIIDVLMFNDKQTVQQYLKEYELV